MQTYLGLHSDLSICLDNLLQTQRGGLTERITILKEQKFRTCAEWPSWTHHGGTNKVQEGGILLLLWQLSASYCSVPNTSKQELSSSLPNMLSPFQLLSYQPFSLRMAVDYSYTSSIISALLDTGAVGNFIDYALLKPIELQIETKSLPRHLHGQAIGEGNVTHYTLEIMLKISALHSEMILFLVTSSVKYPAIFSLHWLQCHNPLMSWTEGAIIQWFQEEISVSVCWI